MATYLITFLGGMLEKTVTIEAGDDLEVRYSPGDPGKDCAVTALRGGMLLFHYTNVLQVEKLEEVNA